MKKVYPLITIAILAFTLIQCKKNNSTTTANSISLYSCSNTNTNAPYICFDSLVSDSRCPKTVECIWMGNAVIKVSFHESANTHPFYMSLKGYPLVSYPADTTINGYHISFTALTPYPDANKPYPLPVEIKATLNISQ